MHNVNIPKRSFTKYVYTVRPWIRQSVIVHILEVR